ncbi:hypothetical protein M3J09_012030 [Ascochyta lentis]
MADASIRAAPGLLESLKYDPAVIITVAETELCLVWYTLGAKDPTIKEWWCPPTIQELATVPSSLLSHHDIDAVLANCKHRVWLKHNTTLDPTAKGIVIFASLIPIIFGLPLLAQASYFIQIVGMTAELSLVILILGIALGFIGNGVGLWVMSKVGRRTLILTSFGISTVLWLGMGIASVWSGTVTIW